MLNPHEPYYDKLKKIKYSLSFQKAAKDKELKELAEGGFEDYLNMIEKYSDEPLDELKDLTKK